MLRGNRLVQTPTSGLNGVPVRHLTSLTLALAFKLKLSHWHTVTHTGTRAVTLEELQVEALARRLRLASFK